MHRRGRPLRRPGPRRGQRAVGMIMFLLCAIPMLFFSMFLSVDLNLAVGASRQTGQAAEYAALAGASQFERNSTVLNPTRAQNAAYAYMARAEAIKAMYRANNINTHVHATSQRVEVKVDYNTPGLVFISILAGNLNFTRTLSRTAFVCQPGQSSGATDGYCARTRL